MKKIYRIDCEWDIGNESVFFSSKDKLIKWVESNLVLQEMYKDEKEYEGFEGSFGDYIDNLREDGYINVFEGTVD